MAETAARKKLRDKLEEILLAEREQRRESGRCGKGRGTGVIADSGSKGS